MADNQNPNNPDNPQDPYRSEMPQYSGGYGSTQDSYSLDEQELDTGASSVAANPGRVLFVIGGAVLFVGFLMYALFSDDSAPTEQAADVSIRPNNSSVSASQGTPPAPVTSVPIPPPPPPPTQATIPAPPPPPPVPVGVTKVEQAKNQQELERRKSPMMAFGGRSASSSSSANKGVTGFAGRDPNLVFSREYLSGTEASQAEATLMGNINYVIAQGKIIDAILETAINTDLPGPLRAIVSRDIYAESGRQVLIPRGSRLIGSYNSSLKGGQTRVYVIWARVIRPDGIDIKIDSPGIDQLGRAGVAGYVDNKYFEMFAAAFLTSSVTVALGVAGDSLLDDGGTSSTNTSDGTTTSSGTAGSQAVLTGINDFSDTTEDILKDILDQEPTITVDQGTRIKVFVNRDLIMPPAVLEQLRIIQ